MSEFKELSDEQKMEIVKIFNRLTILRTIDDETVYLVPLINKKGIALNTMRFSKYEAVKLANAILELTKDML